MERDTRLLEQRNGVTFLECLETCIHNSDFVSQWERLSGQKLLARNAFDRMIDKATGYDMAVMKDFANDVYTCVFKTFREETNG